MAPSKAGGRHHTTRQFSPRCAAIPGLMRARRDIGRTKIELERMAAIAVESGGLIPHSERDASPDAMANLWFMRAVHEFGAALSGFEGEDFAYSGFYAETLIPLCKSIAQAFISGDGLRGIRMDDGGLLVGKIAPHDSLRVNALWYATLEMTAQVLQGGVGGKKDPAGNHFERLAGRFRRSFAKAFWCEDHGCICSPAARSIEGHAGSDHLEPDQILIAVLPVSPLPRTKQRQVVSRLERAVTNGGIRYTHPVAGEVESPLHQAWLARALAHDSPEGRTKAVTILNPLSHLWEPARRTAVHALYRDGQPVSADHHHAKPDPLASAEIFGALEQILGRPNT
jgi:hypothetical protein